MTHAEIANAICEEVGAQQLSTVEKLQLAQVHAVMALVEAVENWSPPSDAPEVVPFEFTREGQAW